MDEDLLFPCYVCHMMHQLGDCSAAKPVSELTAEARVAGAEAMRKACLRITQSRHRVDDTEEIRALSALAVVDPTAVDRQDVECKNCHHAYAFHGGDTGPCGRCDCESFDPAAPVEPKRYTVELDPKL